MLDRSDPTDPIDLPTIIAIAIVAWTAATMLHEVIGHGSVCLLVGGQAQAVSTTELYCRNVLGAQYRLVASAGSLANLLGALICFGLIRVVPRWPPTLYYFLWLFMSTNLFHAGSYMLIGPFTGYGDWAYVIQGFQPELLWKLVLTALGYGICVLGMRLAAMPAWGALLGDDPSQRRHRMQTLTRVPLATALVINLLAGLLSPLQLRWVLTTSLLAPLALLWLVNLPRWLKSASPLSAVRLKKNMTWWILGAIFCIFFIAVLGPGLGSFSGHPLARH
jgi:hypothetical protein